MRTFLLFILLIPLAAKTQNYTYKPFPDSVATWVEQFSLSGGDVLAGVYNYESHCDVYVMEGDTMLADGATWNKLWLYSNFRDTVPNYYFGALKEDSTKKIWLWLSYDTIPFVIYDFGLSKGDSFTLALPGGGNLRAVVLNDDSFNTPSRLLTLKFNTTQYYNSGIFVEDEWLKWQEGVGAVSSGLIYFLDYVSDRTVVAEKRLLCYSLDSVAPGLCGCIDTFYVEFLGINETEPPAPVLYPNPGTNYLHLEFPQATGEINIRAYSVDEKEIYRADVLESATVVNTTEWSSGMYFIVARYNNRLHLTKWIKQ